MSISATTCITYTGTTPLGPTMYLYSDVDGYSTSFGSVATSSITPPNCPYLITGIPDGATILRLRDYVSGCCLDIPITSDNLCIVCNLNLTDYQTATCSQIIAGDLDSSCGEITDYVINWYGPNSTTNIGYTSGLGTMFTYQFTHPLTGSAAIFAQSGTYTPVVDMAIINGIPFSQTGGTGFNPAIMDCFPDVVVDPLTCSNGNYPTQNYTHQYAFSNAGAGVTPQPLSATFVLSANTNYFPFEFKGLTVYDNLKITYSGSAYPGETFTLEWVNVGSNAPGYSYTSFPRSLQSSNFVSKILTLTGFTVNNGDFLTLQVTPNTGISQTNWYFDFTCKESFDCETCLDNYQNNPYPIVMSSVTASTLSCDRASIQYQLSGCSYTNDLLNEDIFKYVLNNTPNAWGGIYSDNSGLLYGAITMYWTNDSCTAGSPSSAGSCSIPNSNTITYTKVPYLLTITCDTYSDFLDFWTEYNNVYATWSGTPYDNTQVEFYRTFAVYVPNVSGATQCGDGTTWSVYNIHFSSTVTSGATTPSGPWYINYSMPTVSSGITYTSCQLQCQSGENSIVSTINTTASATTNNINITTNTGAKAQTTTTLGRRLTVNTSPYTATSFNSGYVSVNPWSVETTPWTGTSTYVNSVSGETCDLSTNFYNSGGLYYKYLYSYKTVLINPSDPRDFEIYGCPITNYVYSGFPSTQISELALRYSGGSITYYNPYYTI